MILFHKLTFWFWMKQVFLKKNLYFLATIHPHQYVPGLNIMSLCLKRQTNVYCLRHSTLIHPTQNLGQCHVTAVWVECNMQYCSDLLQHYYYAVSVVLRTTDCPKLFEIREIKIYLIYWIVQQFLSKISISNT